MVSQARTGLFTAPLPGTAPAGTSPTDGRLVLGGVLGTTPRCLSGGAVTQSGVNMNITLAAAVWELPDVTNASAVFVTPSDSLTFTPTAGPTTGGRIDLIAAKQNNYENGDVDSRVQLSLFPGTASGTPTPPTLPTGYWQYASISVPALITTAAACTITLSNPASVNPLGAFGAFALAAGSVNMTLSSAKSVTAPVSFPAGRFTQPPLVMATLQASPGTARKFTVQVAAPSTTGATLTMSTGDGTSASVGPLPVGWFAIQMTPTSAAG